MRWHHNSKINAWNSNSASSITIHELQTDSAFWNSKTFKEPCRFAIFFEKFTGNLSMIITIPRILKHNTSICRNFKLPGPNVCPTELLLIRSSMFQVSRLEWRPMFWAIARKKIDQIENWRANSNQVAEASACKEGRNQFRCIIRRLFTFHDVGIESFDTLITHVSHIISCMAKGGRAVPVLHETCQTEHKNPRNGTKMWNGHNSPKHTKLSGLWTTFNDRRPLWRF